MNPRGAVAGRRRVRARVEGTVQGVGFRPFVYRLVREHGLAGFVRNDERGVLLEVEGEGAAVERFLDRLAAAPPPLARIERLRRDEVAPTGEGTFAIVPSAAPAAGAPAVRISPDVATCDACLAELFDPGDRRHRYPFVNCTDCGPRFTIVTGVPYDRPLTTMAGFPLCALCRAEYEDPADRRFHAEPVACPDCGPSLASTDGAGAVLARRGEALAGAVAALLGGRIVAVKGLGGYHLACRAGDADAVAALRARKRREDKPFALMAPDLESARSLVALGAEEEALLTARERPIVLAPRRDGEPGAPAVAPAVAPAARELGVMLPYSPLHHLLLADCGEALVMTSGNVSDEPIAFGDRDARRRLGGIADLFLVHDRPIHVRTDDSVARVVAVPGRGATGVGEAPRPRRTLLLRRSRGWVPAGLDLPVAAGRPLLACGAELKNTFCLAAGRQAWVGHHVGDLKNYETLTSFRAGAAHFERLFAVAPEVLVHDLHPDYLSTGYAEERAAAEGLERIAVQHHHAHLAAVLAEHGETGPAVGAIYDGAGHGTDGAVWGGEILAGGLDGCERAGHLHPVRLPGGDRAVRQPWRMACAWLAAALEEEGAPEPPPALAAAVERDAWRAVARLVATGLSAPWTTSAGRLFDAVAALCGVRAEVRYEGQAAIELEAASDPGERSGYPLPVTGGEGEGGGGGPLVLDARPAIRALVADLAAGAPVAAAGGRFHAAFAAATAEAVAAAAAARGLDLAVLSGGVFQNRILLERTAALLAARGLRVLTPERLPPNDGGIAYGQAAVAAWRLAGESGPTAGGAAPADASAPGEPS